MSKWLAPDLTERTRHQNNFLGPNNVSSLQAVIFFYI